MSKAVKETNSKKKQKEKLKEKRPLSKALELLIEVKRNYSYEYYKATCTIISDLYDLSYDELNNAVLGKKDWIK